MLFNSHVFIFAFLPVVLAGFFMAASLGGRRPAVILLVAASMFFYGWWNPAYLLLLGLSVLANWSFGLALAPCLRLRATGRASCRDRVCQYGWIWAVAVSFQKKNIPP